MKRLDSPEDAGIQSPTPDLELQGHDRRVQRIIGDIRGAYETTHGTDPCFARLVNVESVVRFVLLRADPLEGETDAQR